MAAAAPVAAKPIAPTLLATPENAEPMPDPSEDIVDLRPAADFFDRSMPETKFEVLRVSLVVIAAIAAIGWVSILTDWLP